MDLIDIERKKLTLLLHDQEIEMQDYLAAELQKKKVIREAAEQQKLKDFMETKRREAIATRQESHETRQLVNEVKANCNNETLGNLFSNFQGNKLI